MRCFVPGVSPHGPGSSERPERGAAGSPRVHKEQEAVLTLPLYQEEAGRLFVLSPQILCAYLACTPFPSIMAA